MTTYADLAKAFGDRPGELSPPIHVIRRILAVVRGAPLVYAEWRHLPTARGGNGRSGQAVVFTDSRVVWAEFTDSENIEHWSAEDGSSTASVMTWARSALSSVEIESLPEEGNSDRTWAGDWGDGWPPGASVTLRFTGRSEPLRLPLSDQPDVFGQAHLSQLVADLG